MGSKREDLIGKEFNTNRFGKVVITKYEGTRKVTVQFIDYPDEFVTAQLNAIQRGLVTPHFYNVRTLERWKETATKNHSGRYDYSNITEKPYNHQDVLVHCNVCGEDYTVNAELHMNGGGHCKCKAEKEIEQHYKEMSSKITYKVLQESVTRKSKRATVSCVCNEHGVFSATVNYLLKGGICPECSKIKSRISLLSEKEDVLEGVEVLGFTEKLDFILLELSTGSIKIYKPTHLKAKQCSPFTDKPVEQRITFDIFKQRAIEAHGNAYTYSNYKSIIEKLTITHLECGNTFEQLAGTHVSGNYGKGVGCPHCAKYGLSLSRPTNLYVFVADNGYVKVGITHQTPEGRIRQIHKTTRHMFLFDCYSCWSMLGKDAVFVEHEILKLLRQQYKQPEEVFDGSSETFVDASPKEICNLIKKFLEENNVGLLN